MEDIRNLEMRTTINEKDIETINKQLEKISTNTTWILRENKKDIRILTNIQIMNTRKRTQPII
ncbi:hypothetical protein [Bacillus mycoides]|uniref:hypothetical protein n=1 Tax=Bacillus mycoides TaxID=1405 RepID=UPI003D1F9253